VIKIQLQGIEKLQRALDPERFDAAIGRVISRSAAPAEAAVRQAAPRGPSGQTAGKAFAKAALAKKAGNLSSLVLGSKATATPARPGARGGKTRYPYPYPRLLEYGKSSPRKGWLKRAGGRVKKIVRAALRQELAALRRG
jgi:hypothetical protein